MADNNKIGVVGDGDSVMLWRAVGARVEAASNAAEAERAIHRLVHDGAVIIYITESLARQNEETIDRYLTDPSVSIIPIPDRTGTTGYGMERIKANVEKAIGADILFGNEDK